jgi:hypothetical protein
MSGMIAAHAIVLLISARMTLRQEYELLGRLSPDSVGFSMPARHTYVCS